MKAEGPEVTSEETESDITWRKIRRHVWRGLARLAVYLIILLIIAAEIMKGG